MLASWTAGAGLALGLFLGALGSGAIAGAVVHFKNQTIERLRNENAQLKAAANQASENAKRERDRAQAVIDRIVGDLAIAHKLREQDSAKWKTERDAVTSPTTQCLTADAVRVLNQDDRSPRWARADPRATLLVGRPPAVASPRAGPGPAPEPGPGISQRGVSDYLAKVKDQYLEMAGRSRVKTRLIEEARHCFNIIENE